MSFLLPLYKRSIELVVVSSSWSSQQQPLFQIYGNQPKGNYGTDYLDDQDQE